MTRALNQPAQPVESTLVTHWLVLKYGNIGVFISDNSAVVTGPEEIGRKEPNPIFTYQDAPKLTLTAAPWVSPLIKPQNTSRNGLYA